MAFVQDSPRRDPFASNSRSYAHTSTLPKAIPILPSASPATSAEPMDTSSSQTPQPMGPPSTGSSNGDRSAEQQSQQSGQNQQQQQSGGQGEEQQHASDGSTQPMGAAAAAQQPKVVLTAFIHKLYNMLEDQTIQHLISWSNTNESFVMSPSSEFSKVLAQYFKHTNISSFVRQLNMYGFHKVSDVFHTGAPDSPLWEFKHGGGNFKRGDLVGLREIKRRASRHALIHRDSFATAPKMSTPQPQGTPLEPVGAADSMEARLNMLEWNFQDMYARLSRSEEAYANVTSKYHTVLEGLARCHHWSNEISSHLLTIVPDPENPVHRDVYAMRQDIRQHLDVIRAAEEPQQQPEPLFPHRQALFQPPHNAPMELAIPMSPRQRPFDESRRSSVQSLPRPPGVRAPVPPHLQASPRRYGSIGSGNNGTYSPTANRPPVYGNPQPPPPPPGPPQQHPLATMTSPPSNLPRRHTSADIRLQGWEGGQPPPGTYQQGASPYASGQSSSAWPSSPGHPANQGDQQIRDALAQYELPRISRAASRQASPAPPETGPPSFSNSFASSYANSNDAGWQLPGARFPFKNLDNPSRRSSMASNVHSLLNPADTAEREGEDEGPDERKRKRLM